MGLPARVLPEKPEPSFDLEAALMEQYGAPVAGIDEAGRGPWAGPVVVAAVILDPNRIPGGLNDSKLLTPEERADRYEEIVATSIVSVVVGPVKQIDRINILQASLWGMRRAYRGLQVPVGAAITKDEVIIALTQLNNAKVHRDADVLFAFSGGELVKRGWTTIKGMPGKTLMVGGRPMKVVDGGQPIAGVI